MAYERREYQGGAVVTSLTAQINSSALSFSIADTTNWPTGTVGPFYVVIDEGQTSEEKIRCLSRSGSTVTVDTGGRGADGTTAADHSATAVVAHVFVAVDADEANAHYATTSHDHHTQYLNTSRHGTTDHSAALSTGVLADLGDVATTAPAVGDPPIWSGTEWVPASSEGIAVGSANGTYTGNGVSPRTVTLPFTPTLVFLVDQSATTTTDWFAWFSPISYEGTRGVAFKTAAVAGDVEAQAQTQAIPTTDGFIVTADGNRNGNTYRYVAFR